MEDKLRCPECNSTQTRFRVRTKDHICNICGKVYKLEKEKMERKE